METSTRVGNVARHGPTISSIPAMGSVLQEKAVPKQMSDEPRYELNIRAYAA
jgi:hypothetical protein